MRRALAVLLLALPTIVLASTPDLNGSTVECVGCPNTLFVTPAGTGPSFEDRGIEITVTILDALDQPVVGYPFQDVWIDDEGLGFVPCPGGTVGANNADLEGRVSFSGSLHAGGSAENGVWVYIAGLRALNGPTNGFLDLNINSPDLTRDLSVNMADIGTFAIDLASGDAPFRSDFVADGVIDLLDVGRLAPTLGEVCP